MLRLYSRFEEEAESFVETAVHILQIYFSQDRADKPVGTTSLTSISKKIGENISRKLKHEPVPLKSQLRLGTSSLRPSITVGM